VTLAYRCVSLRGTNSEVAFYKNEVAREEGEVTSHNEVLVYDKITGPGRPGLVFHSLREEGD
jgi:hypothetical protein